MTVNSDVWYVSAAIQLSSCKFAQAYDCVHRGKQWTLAATRSKFRRLTFIDRIICGVACVGFAFDTYELLVLTVTVQPALAEFLTVKPGSRELARVEQLKIASLMQGYQEAGSLIVRVLMAILAIFIIGRRRLLHIFQIPGVILIPLVVLLPAMRDTAMTPWGIFFLGTFSVAPFSFWGNYLPTLFLTHLRGTGESFAANVGGPMPGTSAALITTTIVTHMSGGTASRQLGYAAGIVGFLAYAAGFIGSFWLPEPREELITE